MSGTGAEIHEKAALGIKVMQARQFLLQGLQLVVGILLARLLGPEEFGIYAIATFVVAQISSFSNFGIASALVQQKDAIDDRQLRIAFTAQTGIVFLLGAALFFAAPALLLLYPAAPDGLVWLVRALLAPLLLSPVRTVASLRLERNLDFTKLAMIDICETVSFQAVSLVCAYGGMGTWSFAVAAVVRALVGTAAVLWVSPWRFGFAWDTATFRRLLRFGSGFQLQQMVNEAGGWLTPLLAGSILGPAAVGLLTWSSSNGKRPLMFVETVMRVAYPHLSRLQDSPDEARGIIQVYLRWLLVPAGLWLVAAIAFGEPMTRLVYTDKWLPGLLLLQMFALGLGFDIVNWVVGVSGNALGMSGKVAFWVTAKSALAIGTTLAALPLLGHHAIPVAWILASLVSGVGLLRLLGRRIGSVARAVWVHFLPAVLVAGALASLQHFRGVEWWSSASAVAIHLFLARDTLREIPTILKRRGKPGP